MTRPGCGKKTKKGKHRKHTEYTSQSQAKAGNIALAVRKGKLPKSKLKGASKNMARGMTMEELESHSAEAKGKNLPKRKSPKAGTPEGYKAGLSGKKIRSKGKGRGLGRGKGKGPRGVPAEVADGKSYIKERRKLRNRRAG